MGCGRGVGSQALCAPWKLCTACGFTFEWRGHWRRLLLSAEGGHCRTPRAPLAPGGARAGACSAGRSPRALAAAGEALPRRRGARSGARTASARLPAASAEPAGPRPPGRGCPSRPTRPHSVSLQPAGASGTTSRAGVLQTSGRRSRCPAPRCSATFTNQVPSAVSGPRSSLRPAGQPRPGRAGAAWAL